MNRAHPSSPQISQGRNAAFPRTWSKWAWVLSTTWGSALTWRRSSSSSRACTSVDRVSMTRTRSRPTTAPIVWSKKANRRMKTRSAISRQGFTWWAECRERRSGRGVPCPSAECRRRRGRARSARLDGAEAVERSSGGVDVVDDEAELGLVAPPADEQVAVDVDAGVREPPGDPGHAAGLVVDLDQERLALDELVGALLEHGARRDVVGGLEDQVAAFADATAADRAQVHAPRGEDLGQVGERSRSIRELDHELVGHGHQPSRITQCSGRKSTTCGRNDRRDGHPSPRTIAPIAAEPNRGAGGEHWRTGARRNAR